MAESEGLTVVQVLDKIGWEGSGAKSALTRYLAVEETRILLSGGDGKRPTYLESSLPYFKEIKNRHIAKKLSPREAPALIREMMAGRALISAEGALIQNPEKRITEIPASVIVPINRNSEVSENRSNEELARLLRANNQPQKLLTLKDASEEFGLSMRTIKENVRATMDRSRRKYKRSNVAAFIESMEDIAPAMNTEIPEN